MPYLPSVEFRQMGLASRSPDMDPIEHLWNVMERRILIQDSAITDNKKIFKAIARIEN